MPWAGDKNQLAGAVSQSSQDGGYLDAGHLGAIGSHADSQDLAVESSFTTRSLGPVPVDGSLKVHGFNDQAEMPKECNQAIRVHTRAIDQAL